LQSAGEKWGGGDTCVYDLVNLPQAHSQEAHTRRQLLKRKGDRERPKAYVSGGHPTE